MQAKKREQLRGISRRRAAAADIAIHLRLLVLVIRGRTEVLARVLEAFQATNPLRAATRSYQEELGPRLYPLLLPL